MKTLTREGHIIPPLHEVHLTLVVCLSHSQLGEGTAYLACLSLRLSVAWSGEKATFGGCAVFSGQGVVFHDDSDPVKAAVELWPKAVFCNTFWTVLKDAGDPEDDVARCRLVRSICERQACLPPADNTLPEAMKAMTRAIGLALEGLRALADPSVCSGSLESVMYVMPDSDRRSELAKDLPGLGRSITSLLRRGIFFVKGREQFMESIGAMMMIKLNYEAEMAFLAETGIEDISDPQIALDATSEVGKKIAAFHSAPLFVNSVWSLSTCVVCFCVCVCVCVCVCQSISFV